MQIKSTRRPTPSVTAALDDSDVEHPAVIVRMPPGGTDFSFSRSHQQDNNIRDPLGPIVQTIKEALLVVAPESTPTITGIAWVIDTALQVSDHVADGSLAETLSIQDALEVANSAAAAGAALVGEDPPNTLGRSMHGVSDGMTLLVRVADGMGQRVDEITVDQHVLQAVADSKMPGAGLIGAVGKLLMTVFGDDTPKNLSFAPDTPVSNISQRLLRQQSEPSSAQRLLGGRPDGPPGAGPTTG